MDQTPLKTNIHSFVLDTETFFFVIWRTIFWSLKLWPFLFSSFLNSSMFIGLQVRVFQCSGSPSSAGAQQWCNTLTSCTRYYAVSRFIVQLDQSWKLNLAYTHHTHPPPRTHTNFWPVLGIIEGWNSVYSIRITQINNFLIKK